MTTDWAQQFYQRQNELVGVYAGDIQDHHHDRVKLITQHCSASNPTVLELGAGGGQTACATALAGYNTTAIELVSSLAIHATQLAKQHHLSNINILNGDFYSIALDQKFDVITYWDGFGVGTDDEQIQLLKRCKQWLKPQGIMLLDVYTPWYWAKVAGQTMQFGDVQRSYDFDVTENRMLDTWWHTTSPENKVTQSLRCYAPADLQLLLRDTGLVLHDMVETGGAVTTNGYEAHVKLKQAMSYVAQLTVDS